MYDIPMYAAREKELSDYAESILELLEEQQYSLM